MWLSSPALQSIHSLPHYYLPKATSSSKHPFLYQDPHLNFTILDWNLRIIFHSFLILPHHPLSCHAQFSQSPKCCFMQPFFPIPFSNPWCRDVDSWHFCSYNFFNKRIGCINFLRVYYEHSTMYPKNKVKEWDECEIKSLHVFIIVMNS